VLIDLLSLDSSLNLKQMLNIYRFWGGKFGRSIPKEYAILPSRCNARTAFGIWFGGFRSQGIRPLRLVGSDDYGGEEMQMKRKAQVHTLRYKNK
jgi:hypothetical protein